MIPRTTKFRTRFPLVEWLSFTLMVFAASPLLATTTIEVFFEDGTLANGTVAALVADANQDGFLEPDDPTVPGTALVAGETFGSSDDIFVAIFEAEDGAHWNGGAGIADAAEAIDYDALGIVPGTSLILYIFPDASQAGDLLAPDDRVIRYRNTEVGGSGGDIPFVAPSDSGVFTLSALSAAVGGNFDPFNLAGGEIYDEATIGGEDHGDTRATSTWLTSAGLPTGGFILPDDIDYFTFSVNGPATLVVYTMGDTDTVGELMSSNGSALNDPDEDGDSGDDGNFRIEKTVSGGSFYVAVKGASGSDSGAYQLVYEIIPLAASGNAIRPDATIGKSLSRQKGNNFYSQNGSKQELSLSTKKKSLKFVFTIQNDGVAADTVTMAAKGKSKYFDAKYYQLGGGNVTAMVARAGYLMSLAPNASVPFQLKVKPTRKARKSRKSSKQTYLITVRSGAHTDGVKAVAKKK